MKNPAKILVVSMMAMACILGYYFSYFIKTPVYSLKLIGDAVKNRDIVLLEQHVDIESVVDNSFGQIMNFSKGIQQAFNVENPLVSGFVEIMKPVFVSQISAEVRNVIRDEFGSDFNSGKTGILKDDIRKKLQSQGIKLEFVNFVEEERNENEAIVSFDCVDSYGEGINFSCRMARISNGQWCVVEIVNLEDIITRCIQSEILNAQMNMSR